MSTSNTPAITLWDRNLKVTIWKNEKPDGKGVWYEHVPGRVYSGENDKPKSAHTFSGSEPLKLAHLLQRAYEWERQDRLRNKQESEAA